MISEKNLHLLLAKRTVQYTMHIIVLVLSIVLIVMISMDTFRNINFNLEPKFLKW